MHRTHPPARWAALCAAALLACTAAPLRAADATVDVPALSPQTGTAAFIGKQGFLAVRLALEVVNDAGGVDGRKVQATMQDTQSNPQTGVQLMNGVKGGGAQAVIGPNFTAVCNAVAPLVAGGPVSMCLSPGVHPKAGAFMFTTGVGADGMAQGMLTYFKAKHWDRVALISSTDASGQDFEENFNEVLARPANHAITLVEREHFATSDLSVTAQMARIKNAKPDVVIIWTAGTGAGVALQGVHEVGLDVPIAAGNGNMVRAQLKSYKAFIPKTLIFPGLIGMTPATDAPAGVKAAQRPYFAAYAKIDAKPDLPGALAWDPTRLLLDAYKAKGWNATADELRAWMASQRSWTGVNGVYDFAKYPQRGLGVEGVVIDRWDAASGDFVAVSHPGGAPL